MSWNLPDGCTDHDIDMAAPGYWDDPEPEDDFDEEAYLADLAFEVVADAQAEWSAVVFAEALAIPRKVIPRKPVGRREANAFIEVIA